MKFCAKCGMQMSNESAICPQCQTPTNEQFLKVSKKQCNAKKKFDITYIVIALVVTVLAFNIFAFAYFASTNNSNFSGGSNTNMGSEFTSGTTLDTCPEDEYGHHDWSPATCVRPACCYNCNAYKDNNLGYHKFELDDETGIISCWYCYMLKEEYDSEA